MSIQITTTPLTAPIKRHQRLRYRAGRWQWNDIEIFDLIRKRGHESTAVTCLEVIEQGVVSIDLVACGLETQNLDTLYVNKDENMNTL